MDKKTGCCLAVLAALGLAIGAVVIGLIAVVMIARQTGGTSPLEVNIQGILPGGQSNSPSGDAGSFDGVWVQQDGAGVDGQYAFLFRNGKLYAGFKGSTANEILNDEYGLRGGTDGIPYTLTSSSIVMHNPDGSTTTWKRSGDTFWIGTGVISLEDTTGVQGPNLVSVSMDGEYVKE